MAYAVVQSQIGTSSGGTTAAAANWGGTTVAGNLLVVLIATMATAIGAPTISTPTGYSVARAAFGAAGGSNSDPRMAAFYIEGAASVPAGTAVNITLGTSARFVMYLYEISGVLSSSALDQTAVATTSSASAMDTGTTAGLAATNDFAIGMVAQRNNPTFSSPTNGFAIDRQDHSGTSTLNSQVDAAVLTKTLSSSSGANSGATSSIVNAFSGLILTFKAASGNQTVSPTGLGSAQAFGAITISTGGTTVHPTGLASAQSFGAVSANMKVNVSGLGSAQALGVPTVTLGGVGQTVHPSGLGSAGAFGTVTPLPGPVTASLTGLGSAQAFGSVRANQKLSVAGLGSAQAFGAVSPSPGGVLVLVAGLVSAQAFGGISATTPHGSVFDPAIHGGKYHR